VTPDHQFGYNPIEVLEVRALRVSEDPGPEVNAEDPSQKAHDIRLSLRERAGVRALAATCATTRNALADTPLKASSIRVHFPGD
jgi:hypothetical protein